MPPRPSLRWVWYPALGLMTWDLIHYSLFRFQWVNGPSMSPTLSPHHHDTGSRDLILVIRRSLFSGSALQSLQRGDIVTLTAPHKPEHESVKRVVALPGDTVLRDVRRVGKQEEEQGRRSEELGLKPLPPVVRVGAGSCWVEGDAWRRSRDSNDFGPVSLSLVNGRVWGVVWPPGRFGAIPRAGRAEDSRTMVIKGEPPSMEEVDLI